MKKLLLMALLLAAAQLAAVAREQAYTIQSPDGRLSLRVECGDRIAFSVERDQERVVSVPALALARTDAPAWGRGSRLQGIRRYRLDERIPAPFYKRSEVEERCNGLVVSFREGFDVEFRAYDDGVAYRFVSRLEEPATIRDEEARFRFAEGATAFVPYVRDNRYKHDGTPFGDQFMQSFENVYTHTPLAQMDTARLAFLPLLVKTPTGVNVCITDADLEAYPGMFLRAAGGEDLEAVFAPYPRSIRPGGYDRMQGIVERYEPYIAQAAPEKSFPWRVLCIAARDADLAASDMVWRLASPCRLDDTDWIEPGKAAWEWWNGWGLSGVDFEAGINQRTYEYYIDFAARNGLRYVVLDDGWSAGHHDPMHSSPELDLPALVAYGAERGVGLILWIGYLPFAERMEALCEHYGRMGIKGFKVDFMDRDDQPLTEFVYEAARTAARHRLLLDLHGIYKPTGLQRTYPNVLNFEGVHGLEQVKWSPAEVDQVTYDVTMPFVRMLAGPADYTPGAMRNATRANFRPVDTEPMSQGTRCRQLAAYVLFDAPLAMLCDSPTAYEREPECLHFLAGIPTVWEQTHALAGEVGRFLVTARCRDGVWYVGGMTGWEEHTAEVALPFLPDGAYDVELFRDGDNAGRIASDYRRETFRLDADKRFRVKMAPGGGFAARITRR